MSDVARWLAPIVAVVVVAPAVIALVGFLYLTNPPRHVGTATPAALGWAFEEVRFTTPDGFRLHAWHIPAADAPPTAGGRPPTVIMVHGYPFDKSGLLDIAQFLHDGYDLFLFDVRSFGQSEGGQTSLGHRERQDLVAAVEFLRARGVDRVGVWGFSLGGAITLLGLPDAPAIRAAVVDSPFTDLHTMATDYYRPLPVVNHLLVFYTDLLARLFFQTSLSEISPERAAVRADRPIFVLHGDRDTTVPPDHFDRLRIALAANPAAEFWLVAGSGHTQGHVVAPDAYRTRIRAFFARHLAA